RPSPRCFADSAGADARRPRPRATPRPHRNNKVKDATTGSEQPFHVPWFLDALGALVYRCRPTLLWLARRESGLLAEQLRSVAVRKPIFISGLARSGSTLLHEVVCSHPNVATHRSKDYPMLFTPFWWRQATAGLRPGPPRQRLHQDGVMVT